MSESDKTVAVELRQEEEFRFAIDFGAGLAPLVGDEPPPLGKAAGPSPAQLLTAAVGNCLSDSLYFAFRKFSQAVAPITTRAAATVGRNPEGRMRVLRIEVTLQLGVPAAGLQHVERVMSQFEGFCTVTQSVGQGIPVHARVVDAAGVVLKD